MRLNDTMPRARGLVTPSFVNLATGERIAMPTRHNTLSYMSAEAMAAAFGGDPSYIPARIGFIYGSGDTMPTESDIDRNQSWDKMMSDFTAVTGQPGKIDVQVVDFSYPPSLGGYGFDDGSSSDSGSDSSSGDEYDPSNYTNTKSTGANAVTFHAVSNSTDGGKVAGQVFLADSYIYQALLLAVHDGKYYIVARVSLEDGARYLQKPDGFEVALDWTVVFK